MGMPLTWWEEKSSHRGGQVLCSFSWCCQRQVKLISRADIPVSQTETVHGFASCLKGQCKIHKLKEFPSLLANTHITLVPSSAFGKMNISTLQMSWKSHYNCHCLVTIHQAFNYMVCYFCITLWSPKSGE